jgi:hypothetical protein
MFENQSGMFVDGRNLRCHKQGRPLLRVKDSAPQIHYFNRDKLTRNITAHTPQGISWQLIVGQIINKNLFSWNPKLYYRVHKRLSLDPILNQFNSFNYFKSYFFTIHFNIIPDMSLKLTNILFHWALLSKDVQRFRHTSGYTDEYFNKWPWKGKAVPAHTMEAHGGVEVQLSSFLTLVLDGSMVSFKPRPISASPLTGTMWIGDLVLTRAAVHHGRGATSLATSGKSTMIPWLSSP